jgi:regulatory protein
MYILEIKQTGTAKNKYKVCLEGGADFVLYKRELSKLHIEAGQDLPEELYEQILKEIQIPRAKKRAMHLLEKMDRTEQQLRTKLREAGYASEAIEDAISYVKSYHYIDDERYARTYIRIHQQSKSKQRLKMDLLKKGIDKEVIDLALEEEFEQSEEEMILQLLKKKHYDPSTADQKERNKMYRFLMQRGFRSSDISHVIGQLESYGEEY